MADCYVYIIFRPNGIPCYVGKGSGDRCFRQRRRPRNAHLRNIIAGAHDALPMILIYKGSEQEAYETETALIAVLGLCRDGGVLVNHGLGGNGGPCGVQQLAAQRAKRSADAKAMWADPTMRAQIIAKQRGNRNSKKPHVLTAEWLAVLTSKMLGNTNTLGFHHSDEAKAMMSAYRKGKPKTRKARAMMQSQLKLFDQ